MPVVGGYHHVHLISADPEGAARWLERFLGARVEGREEARGARNVILRVGEAVLSVRTPRAEDNLAPSDGRTRPGLDHVCFLVDGLAGMLGDMKRGGVTVELEIPGPAGGSAAAFVRGPENVLFELIQAK